MSAPFPDISRIGGGQLVLRRLEPGDAPALRELVENPRVYRYLPTFLAERQDPDPGAVIDSLCPDCPGESLILGIVWEDRLCGLMELYGFVARARKISVGYRLMERYWGRGIATRALGLMLRYLDEQTRIDIVTASTMVENHASAAVLRRNGFSLFQSAVEEDWGYGHATLADKWIRRPDRQR